MQKIAWVLAGVVLFCAPALAQQSAPFVDLAGNYSYLRASETKSNYNGASVSLSINTNQWLGLVADVGGYHQAVPARAESANIVTYLLGPRVYYREDQRITPFVQTLLGGAHNTLTGQSSIALTAGGGFDVKIDPRVSLRVIQAEYLMTRFGTVTQNNMRISAGIVFHFGGVR